MNSGLVTMAGASDRSPRSAATTSGRPPWFSIAVTLVSLFIFGYVKGKFTTARPLRSALQTALIGAIAAGAAFLIATAIA